MSNKPKSCEPGSYETLYTAVDSNGILTVTLSRPDALNAFTTRMMEELVNIFDHSDADDAVRAVIVTGDGRAFCAGADLSGGGDTFKLDKGNDRAVVDWSSERLRDAGGRLTLRIFESVKPVIGAINGAAVGIGATMLLPMDQRIASSRAKFGFVFARRGIVPEACSSWFLPRLVGISQALDWCYSGELFGAEQALSAGLVNAVVPGDELLAKATESAVRMTAESAPVSLALTRQMMWRMLGADHPMEAHKVESKALFTTGRSPDAEEGVTAFLEKRKARFSGSPSDDMPSFYPWWDDRMYS